MSIWIEFHSFDEPQKCFKFSTGTKIHQKNAFSRDISQKKPIKIAKSIVPNEKKNFENHPFSQKQSLSLSNWQMCEQKPHFRLKYQISIDLRGFLNFAH